MMLRNSLLLSLIVAVGFIFSVSAEDFAVEDEITSYDAEAGTTLKDDVKTVVEGKKQDASSDEEDDEEDEESSEKIVNPMAEAANAANSSASESEEDNPEAADKTDESTSSSGNSHLVSINLTDIRAVAEVKLGQIVEVVLDNPHNKTWNYDKSTKFLKILDTLETDGKFRITYEVINVGTDRLYFDLVDNTGGKFVVLESKFLDIKSEN